MCLNLTGRRMNEELMKGASAGARAAMSDSGWSTASVFREYLETHFLKHVKRDNENQPVLLILDGHTRHTSPDMIKFAQSKQIHLFVLPAHTSHVLQPLDVAVFGPFKRFYYSDAAYMKANMGKVVTKYEIASIACTAYLKSMSSWNIVSAFKKTGIFPLNENNRSHGKTIAMRTIPRQHTP